MFYEEIKPKVIQYRKYKSFSNEFLMHELEITLSRFSRNFWGSFEITMRSILQEEAPLKRKYAREILLV